jgi:hypothetical protein
MSTGDSYDDDDDRPRRRRDRDDDDRPRRKRRLRRRRPKKEFSDDNYLPWTSNDPLGTTAMYLGIGSILLVIVSLLGICFCLPFVLTGVIVALILGIVAVILGSMARNRTRSGMGLAGIITGISGIALAATMILLMVLGIGFLTMKHPEPQRNPPPEKPIFGLPNK